MCHRNVQFDGADCIFISTRLMQDRPRHGWPRAHERGLLSQRRRYGIPFLDPLPRYPEIVEDEPPLRMLCNEYGLA